MNASGHLLLVSITMLLQGCIYFATGPERSFAGSQKMNQISVQSVARVKAKVERLTYASGQSCYSLKLVAEGRFLRHTGHYGKKGTPCMAVGLWPGCADNENWFAFGYVAILANGALCAIPTLVSLVFEPFYDYHERVAEMNCADLGLIGFSKYYRDVSRDQTKGFATDSTEAFSSYELYGYSVMIDGVRYEDKDNGSGCQGVIYFCSTRPKGSRISIKIVEVPSARSDGNLGFAGMMGMEIPATLP